jgi:NADPH2:quinone reductase
MALTTMKALTLTRPDPSAPPQLSLSTSTPIPTPGPSQLLLKLTASLINPSDILNSNGVFLLTSFPRIPGRDFAGVVVSEGPRSGERVFGTSGNVLSFSQDGSHAEYMLVPSDAVFKIPEGMSDIEAASVGVPFTASLLALTRAGAKEGETVMVIGASGAVGSAGVQVAQALGCKVLRAARGATGDGAVDIKADPTFSSVASLTNGKGVDVVFDTVGIPSMTKDAIGAMATRGRLVFIAAPRKGSTEMGFEMDKLYRKEQGILGCNTLLYGTEETGKMIGKLAGWIESGRLSAPKTEGLVKVGLDGAVQAYEEMRGGGKRKFMIVMGEGEA